MAPAAGRKDFERLSSGVIFLGICNCGSLNDNLSSIEHRVSVDLSLANELVALRPTNFRFEETIIVMIVQTRSCKVVLLKQCDRHHVRPTLCYENDVEPAGLFLEEVFRLVARNMLFCGIPYRFSLMKM